MIACVLKENSKNELCQNEVKDVSSEDVSELLLSSYLHRYNVNLVIQT